MAARRESVVDSRRFLHSAKPNNSTPILLQPGKAFGPRGTGGLALGAWVAVRGNRTTSSWRARRRATTKRRQGVGAQHAHMPCSRLGRFGEESPPAESPGHRAERPLHASGATARLPPKVRRGGRARKSHHAVRACTNRRPVRVKPPAAPSCSVSCPLARPRAFVGRCANAAGGRGRRARGGGAPSGRRVRGRARPRRGAARRTRSLGAGGDARLMRGDAKSEGRCARGGPAHGMILD